VQVLQLIVSGAAQGCIYGLIALGFVLIYKATETVSFAQGDLMMLGAFAGLVLMTMLGFPFWLAALAAVAAMVGLGVVVERAVIRPILGQPAFSIVMLTIGIGYIVRGLVTMIPVIGTETHTLPVPYKDARDAPGWLVLAYEQLVVIGATALLCLGLYALFRYSKIGIAMQAASQNQLAAYYMGIPVQRLNGLVWGLAAGGGRDCRAAAGADHLRARQHGFHRAEGVPGGGGRRLRQPARSHRRRADHRRGRGLAGFYLPEGFKDIAPYVVVLLMLMIKPNGLFGEKLRKKV
jgi:branched-chain amino acid transport system permease protein